MNKNKKYDIIIYTSLLGAIFFIILGSMDHIKDFKEEDYKEIEGEVTLEKLQKASMFHIDCGTIHACNIVVFYAVLCFNLANILNIGLFKFLLHL